MTDRFTPAPVDDQLNFFGPPSDLGEYPDLPGHRGVDTSAAAAAAIAPDLGRLQRLVLDAIAEAGARGLTAHELAEATRLPREAAQPRISELRKKGRVADSGQRRFNASGRRAIAWSLPEYKRSASCE